MNANDWRPGLGQFVKVNPSSRDNHEGLASVVQNGWPDFVAILIPSEERVWLYIDRCEPASEAFVESTLEKYEDYDDSPGLAGGPDEMDAYVEY